MVMVDEVVVRHCGSPSSRHFHWHKWDRDSEAFDVQKRGQND